MKMFFRFSSFLAMLLIFCYAVLSQTNSGREVRDLGVSYNAGQGRSLSKNRLVSQKFPTAVIDVDKSMCSLGVINFPLKKVAQVERYLWATENAGKIQRLFIVQLEAVLPGVKGGYTFEVTNPTRIGKYDYQTSVGLFNFGQSIAANPGAEAEKTKAYVEGLGLTVDGEFRVARYARVADDEKRREIIFFYLESVSDSGLTRSALETSEAMRDFARRSLQSFRVVDRE